MKEWTIGGKTIYDLSEAIEFALDNNLHISLLTKQEDKYILKIVTKDDEHQKILKYLRGLGFFSPKLASGG